MIEMLIQQIFDNELFDEEFCEYLEKNLDGTFDSSLIMSGDTFSHKFNSART